MSKRTELNKLLKEYNINNAELSDKILFLFGVIDSMKKYSKPKVGQKLFYPKYGLLTVRERGVFKRGNTGRIGIFGDSEYSIMEDANGNIIMHEGKTAWFYDDFLTNDNFELAVTTQDNAR